MKPLWRNAYWRARRGLAHLLKRIAYRLELERSGERTVLTPDLLARLDGPLTVIDGGARAAFVDPRWQTLPQQALRLFGFEPDPQECAALNSRARNAGLDFHFYPLALWGKPGQLPFYELAEGSASSCYPLNQPLSDRWRNHATETPFREFMRPVRTLTLDATTLEIWSQENGVKAVDFIKLNVQGAELEILSGAGSLLDGVLGMQLEMSFCPTYQGAPLFSDLDPWLRERGFTFFDALAPHFAGRARAPVLCGRAFNYGPMRWPSRQVFEGHFLYLRDPLAAGAPPMAENEVVKLAVLAELYGQVEFAFELLDWHLERSLAHPLTAELRELLIRAASTYGCRGFGLDESALPSRRPPG